MSMNIICDDLSEYIMLVKQCVSDWYEDNCKCCVLRGVCGKRETGEHDDIEAFMAIDGGSKDG